MTFRTPRWIPVPIACALAAVLAAAPGTVAGHEYHQAVWFTWDTTELDVIVLGVEDPVVGAAIRDAIDAWRTGIAQLAPPWLANAHEIRAYFPAFDVAPPAGFEAHDVEIFFVPAGFMAVHDGESYPSIGKVCESFAPVGYPALDLAELYHTAGHEFGHCLGLDHVFEHGVEYEPAFDLLGGGGVHTWYGPSCPSNLNVQVLERVYGGLFNLPSGGNVVISSGAYSQAAC